MVQALSLETKRAAGAALSSTKDLFTISRAIEKQGENG
jgi:hypothetical protein